MAGGVNKKLPLPQATYHSPEAAPDRSCCSFGTWFDRKRFCANFPGSRSDTDTSTTGTKTETGLEWPTIGAQETN